MRGGHLHNAVLLGPLIEFAATGGARVRLERWVDPLGFIDATVETPLGLVAIEAERTSRRVLSDVAKAERLGAAELWIVVPTSLVAHAVDRRIEALPRPPRVPTFVLTQGAAKHRLAVVFARFRRSNEGMENNSAGDPGTLA